MRLIACPTCHTQYDVTRVVAERFHCRCGAEVENRTLQAVDAPAHRCGACGALVQDAGSCDYCGASLAVDPARLSLICPECFARNADEARFCTACGVAFRPEPVLAQGYELPCPVCGALMPPRQFVGLAINECPNCNGLWVPEQHFDALMRRAIEARRGADPELLPALEPRVSGANPAAQSLQYRKCPECDAFMQRRNFRKSSGVILDVCHEHGTWLDADELEQIAGFILRGGETSPLLAGAPEPSPEQRRADAGFARILAEHTRIGVPADGARAGSLLDVLTRLLS